MWRGLIKMENNRDLVRESFGNIYQPDIFYTQMKKITPTQYVFSPTQMKKVPTTHLFATTRLLESSESTYLVHKKPCKLAI